MSKELEIRFGAFAMGVRDFCLKLKWDTINRVYIQQLIRSSGSIKANYLEASEGLGKADELMKLRISRREAKESIHWLELVLVYDDQNLEKERTAFIDEAAQLTKILSAIIVKLSPPTNRNK